VKWLDYVNLSIDHVNPELFRISSKGWHKEREIFWVVLAFNPVIMTHPGVYFVTTNNMWSGARRATGENGFAALYEPIVVQWVDRRGQPARVAKRLPDHPHSRPTCAQAEVLYPGPLSLDHLTAIYVETETDEDYVHSFTEILGGPDVQALVRPELFPAEMK
jgi:hypothetical protein